MYQNFIQINYIMGKFTRLLSSVLLLAGFAATSSAAGFSDAAKEKASVSNAGIKARLTTAVTEATSSEIPTIKLKEGKVAPYAFSTASVKRSSLKGAKVKAMEVSGEKLQMNFDCDTAFFSSGPVKIEKIGTDSLAFWYLGNHISDSVSVKAKVDWAKGTLAIDPQLMFVSSSYGDCYMYAINPIAKTYDRTTQITGKIEDDQITLSPWACIIVSEGTYKGYAIGTFLSMTVIKDYNAKMTGTAINSDSTETAVEYKLYVEQTASNQVRVYNFAGISSCVDIDIRSNKTLYIAPHYLFKSSNYGYFYNYKADWSTGYYYPRQKTVGTADTNKLSWGNWTIASSNGKYIYAKYKDSEIALPFDLTFPAGQTQEGFKGAGTADDPYLIENAADLFALSDSVNNSIRQDTTIKYVRAYEGKYFKQTANINMKGYRFTPIGGSDDYFRFAGTYDGGNKTIQNLDVETGSRGYCALFGAVDTMGVIKNVKMDSPRSKAQYYYTGTVAAFCMGTVDNCSVSKASVSGQYCVGGVIGYAGPTTNASFTNGIVIGETQVGGVIGVTRNPVSKLYSTGSTITCTSSYESSSAGGVVGYVSQERKGRVSDCYFSGNVVMSFGNEYAGTVVGIAVESTVERCFSIGQLTALKSISSGAVGGIVGGAQGVTISNCHFAGNLTASTINAGHMLGYCINVNMTGYSDHSTISNCFTTGYALMGTTTQAYNPYVGRFDTTTGGSAPVIENCKYDAQMVALIKDKSGSSTTAEMATATAWDNFDTNVWVFSDGIYPRVKGLETTSVAKVAASPVFFASTSETTEGVTKDFTVSTANSVTWKAKANGTLGTAGNGINIESANVYLNGSFATDTLYASYTNMQKWVVIKTSPSTVFEGKGTADDPFLIKTKDDLIKLSKGTSDNRLTFDGTYFLMTNDIDLEYDTVFKGISSTDKEAYAFGGIFDGGNHSIHRCKLQFATLDADNKISTTHSSKRGFISTLKTIGTVKNLRIASDCEFIFYSQSAAVVGYNYGGTIENCRNYANVTGYSGNIGGISSYCKKGSVVRDCYNSGCITTGFYNASGIVVFNYGVLDNCQNDGEIRFKKLSESYKESNCYSSAGICNSNLGDGMITNVLNTGYIHTNKYTGGICSVYNGTKDKLFMKGALNLGMLDITTTSASDKATIGNIVGKLYKTAACENVYYDAQVSTFAQAHSGDIAGGIGATTDELTSGKALEGLSTDYWYFEKGKYPVLKTFMDEQGSKAAAVSVVNFNSSSRSDSIKVDADLASADSLSWRVVKGKAFKVDGNVLCMDPADVLSDTLVATYGNFVKRIPIVAMPDSVAVPVITSATVDGKTIITITTDTEGAAIYYTIDGNDPSTSSDQYKEGGVELTKAGEFTVKAIATKHNFYASAIAVAKITVMGVDDVDASKAVLGKKYVSASGITSDTPFEGMNIVITLYEDGTQSVEKKVLTAE